MSLIGAIRVVMGLDSAQYDSRLRRTTAQTRTSAQSISRSFSVMAAAGRLFAAGAGATFLYQQGKAALEFAANLGETSQSIGVTVEQLQILRRAATENGASVEGMERALGILNRTLGQARAGVPAAVQAFRALRIDPQQFTSAGQVLPRVMESIRQLRTVSEQAAAAQRLMGRGAAEMLPLLVQGAAGWERYATEARAAGLVTEEQARTADEAMDALGRLSVTIQTRLASALADVLPHIENLIRGLDNIVGAAGRALGLLNSVGSAGPSFMQRMAGNALNLIPGSMVTRLIASFGEDPNPPRTGMGSMIGRVTGRPTTGGNDLDLSPRGGGGGRGDAERRRKEALRREHDFEADRRRTQIDIKREEQSQLDDAMTRGDVQLEILALEREQFVADQRLAVQLGEQTEARAAILLADYDLLQAERQSTILIERRHEDMRERAELARQSFEYASEQLRQEAELADTAAERRRIELALLDLTERFERARLQRVLLEERAGSAAAIDAQRQLDGLDASFSRQRAGVLRSTMGPMETFLAGLPNNAAKMNEAFEQVAAQGLGNVVDGLAQALTNIRSLGDAFKAFRNIAMQSLQDVIRVMLQRGLAQLLSSFGQGAGAKSGDGGGFDPIATVASFASKSGKLPGFAGGGSLRIAGMAGVDRNVLSINTTPVARVGMGETIDITPAGGRRGGGGPSFHFDLRGAVVTQDLLDQMNAIGANAALAGSGMAQQALYRRAGRRLGRSR